MNQPITMPALSDTMNNGRLVRWLKHIGDPIRKGEAVAEVETDKAIMDVEAFHDGYLGGPLATEDTEATVGQVIGYIVDSPTAAVQPGAAAQVTVTTPAAGMPVSEKPGVATAPAPTPPGARLSPYARRLAQQRAMQPVPIPPPPAAAPAANPADRIAWPSTLRESMAQNIIRSLATPTFHVTAQLGVGPLQKSAAGTSLSFTLLLARAAALAVKTNPLFNAAYTPEGLTPRQRVDVGIAVDTPDGLIPAVLRDVAERPLAQLGADWRALRDRVSSRRLTPPDYQGATFYLSNLGTFRGRAQFRCGTAGRRDGNPVCGSIGK